MKYLTLELYAALILLCFYTVPSVFIMDVTLIQCLSYLGATRSCWMSLLTRKVTDNYVDNSVYRYLYSEGTLGIACFALARNFAFSGLKDLLRLQ